MKLTYFGLLAALFFGFVGSIYSIALLVIENKVLSAIQQSGSVKHFQINYDLSAELIGFRGHSHNAISYEIAAAKVSPNFSFSGINYFAEIRDLKIVDTLIPYSTVKLFSPNLSLAALEFDLSLPKTIWQGEQAFESLEATGKIYPDDARLENLTLKISDYEYFTSIPVKISELKSEFEFISWKNGSLSLYGQYSLKDAFLATFVDKFDVTGDFEEQAGSYYLTANVSEIVSNGPQAELQSVAVNIRADKPIIDNLNWLDVSISEMSLSGSVISEVSLEIDRNFDEYIMVQGEFTAAELVYKNLNVASLGSTNFQSKIDQSDTKKMGGRFSLETASSPPIAVKVSAEINCGWPLELHHIQNNCNDRAAELTAELEIAEELIKAEGRCRIGNLTCRPGSMSAQVVTANTSRAYEELLATNAANPILLGLLFLELSNGEKIGEGHRLGISTEMRDSEKLQGD